MPRCPVCQTKYVAGKTDYCTLCGWNLQPYSLVVGLVPEVLLKEHSRLEWARGLWAIVKPHREEIHQLQNKIHEAEQTLARLRYELEQAHRGRNQLAESLRQRELEEVHRKKQSEYIQKELDFLRRQLEQANQARDQLYQTLQQQEVTLAQIQSQVKQMNQTQQENKEVILEQINTSQSQRVDNNFVHPEDKSPENKEITAIPSSINHNLPEETTATSTSEESSPKKLERFSFQVVKVDIQGNVVENYQASALYFLEKLSNQENLENLIIEMVSLPGGTFWMGSKETEEGREIHEEPLHEVKIKPFYISRFPITQAIWRKIANLPTINRSLNPDPSSVKHDLHPVGQVCWYDAVEFCGRLAKLTGRDYRLPSEAEWEYACRAGTTTPFHFGETITSKLVNFDGSYTYGSTPEGEYNQGRLPIHSYKVANAFGLSDMHGNAWEWCADTWHDNYKNAPSDGSIWSESGVMNRRILRGGSWYCLPNLCRSAQRHWDLAEHGGTGISFRLALSD